MGPGALHHRPGLGQQGIVHGVDQDDLFQIRKQRHQLSLNEGFVGHGGGGAAGALTQHPQAEDAVLADTTDKNLEQSLALLTQIAKERLEHG